jgi:hypothetical protein
MSDVDVARGAVLNEQELWREMVRWSGGLVHEEMGADLYRRIGFSDLGTTIIEYESPEATPAR